MSTSELFAIGANIDHAGAHDARSELVVGGVAVALVSAERSRINPMRSTSAEGMPSVEVLAAVAAQDPTGVLALESADGLRGFAFDIVNGRVTSAQGTGELGQLERWCAALHLNFPDRFKSDADGDPMWIQLARTFVNTSVLDELELALEVGSQMTFVRGEVEWIGTRLPADRGIRLSHLLLEHARHRDELPKLRRRLQPDDRIVVPVSQPPAERPRATDRAAPSDSSWDFVDDPDSAAIEEWEDVRAVWRLCDGETTIAEIAANSMLGRFRALAALATVLDERFALLGEERPRRAVPTNATRTAPVLPFGGDRVRTSAPVTEPRAEPPAEPAAAHPLDRNTLAALAADPHVAREAIEAFIGSLPEWIGEIDTATSAGQIDDVRRVAAKIASAARAIGAPQLGSVAGMVAALAADGDTDAAADMVGEMEIEYANVFRVLMAFHAELA